jgi:hypothetical protein
LGEIQPYAADRGLLAMRAFARAIPQLSLAAEV